MMLRGGRDFDFISISALSFVNWRQLRLAGHSQRAAAKRLAVWQPVQYLPFYDDCPCGRLFCSWGSYHCSQACLQVNAGVSRTRPNRTREGPGLPNPKYSCINRDDHLRMTGGSYG